MGRFRQPPRTLFQDAELEAYDAVIARMVPMRSSVPGLAPEYDEQLGAPDIGEYWGALLHSPLMAQISIQMGKFVRAAGERPDSYSHADRELVDQVLAVDWATNVVQGHHVPDAVSAGVRLEAIEALRAGEECRLSDDERLLAAFTRATVNGAVDEGLLAAMRQRLGDRGTIEYIGFILWLQWIIRFMQAVGCHDPDDSEVEALVQGIKSGSIAVPNFRDRIA